MKTITQAILVGMFASLTCFGQNQSPLPKKLVTLTGQLEPKFSVKVKSSDIEAISRSLNDMNHLQPIELNVNDLLNPEDEVPIREAANRLSRIFISIAENIADMRMITYQLSALSQLSDSNSLLGLYQAYNAKFNDDYGNVIHLLSAQDATLKTALQKCTSSLCVINIGLAQKDLFRFGNQLNLGFTVNEASKFNFEFKFKSSLINASLNDTYHELLPNNQEHSAYTVLIAAIISPFISGAKESAKISENLIRAIISPKTEWLKLKAEKQKIDLKQEISSYQTLLDETLFKIINGHAFVPKPGAGENDLHLSLQHVLAAHEIISVYGGYQQINQSLSQTKNHIRSGFIQLNSSFSDLLADVKESQNPTDTYYKVFPFQFRINENGGITLQVSVYSIHDTLNTSTFARFATFTLDQQNPSLSTWNIKLAEGSAELPLIKGAPDKDEPNPLAFLLGAEVGYGGITFKDTPETIFDLSQNQDYQIKSSAGKDKTRMNGFNAKFLAGIQLNIHLSNRSSLFLKGTAEYGIQGSRGDFLTAGAYTADHYYLANAKTQNLRERSNDDKNSFDSYNR